MRKTVNMEDVGWLSILPPLVAILLAIWSRQVYLSLLAGIFLGYLILAGGRPDTAFVYTLEGMVKVFSDEGNTRTIFFCALVGGLILLFRCSGGVQGLIAWIQKRMDKDENQNKRRRVQGYAYLLGLLIFIETSISSLTVGTVFRPLFDKMKISREKLAYLADSSSAPSSILIPINAWGAFIMGLLLAEGIDEPFKYMMIAIPFNFYPIITIVLALVVVYRGWHIGPMRIAEENIKTVHQGQHIENEDNDWMSAPADDGVTYDAKNMMIPLITMIVAMPIVLLLTGIQQADLSAYNGLEYIMMAMGAGSGSQAVLTAVVLSIVLAVTYYKAKGVLPIKRSVDVVLKGTSSLLPLALLMLLAFAIGDVCRHMGTGPFVASVVANWLNPALLPMIVFLLSCVIAFSTGTSWGTFAIMMAITIPVSQDLDADIYLTIAAVMGGGVFGDHCSPISDTTIISSLASGTNHIDHVRTQLPYALIGGGVAVILYALVGFIIT